jgi:pyruvate-formate lyase
MSFNQKTKNRKVSLTESSPETSPRHDENNYSSQGSNSKPSNNFHEVKIQKKNSRKIYVFIISYDKQKGVIEKTTVNLIVNSLKDYIKSSFSEIKALTDNNKLIKVVFFLVFLNILKEDFI